MTAQAQGPHELVQTTPEQVVAEILEELSRL